MGIVAVVRKSLGIFKVSIVTVLVFFGLALSSICSEALAKETPPKCHGDTCTSTLSNSPGSNNILSFASIPTIPSPMVIGDPPVTVTYVIKNNAATGFLDDIVTNYDGGTNQEITRLSDDSCHNPLYAGGKCEIKLKISPDTKQPVPRVLSLQLKISADDGRIELDEAAPHSINIIGEHLRLLPSRRVKLLLREA